MHTHPQGSRRPLHDVIEYGTIMKKVEEKILF